MSAWLWFGILLSAGIAVMMWVKYGSGEPLEAEPELYVPSAAVMSVPEMEFFALMDCHREKLGLKALKTDRYARQLASEHLKFMIEQGAASHTNFEYRQDDLLAVGAQSVLEIVIPRHQTPQGMLDAYLRSVSHRAAIEDRGVTHVGVACERVGGLLWNVCLFVKYPIEK